MILIGLSFKLLIKIEITSFCDIFNDNFSIIFDISLITFFSSNLLTNNGIIILKYFLEKSLTLSIRVFMHVQLCPN